MVKGRARTRGHEGWPVDVARASKCGQIVSAVASGYSHATWPTLDFEARTTAVRSGEMSEADANNSPIIRAFSGPKKSWRVLFRVVETHLSRTFVYPGRFQRLGR